MHHTRCHHGRVPPPRPVAQAARLDRRMTMQEGFASEAINQDWVTKTELMTYVRCPYTYSLLHRGEIDRSDLFDEFLLELLAEGKEFHDRVDATALPSRSIPKRNSTSFSGRM